MQKHDLLLLVFLYDTLRIVSHFVLAQFFKIFGIAGPHPAVSSYFGGAQSHAFLRKCKSMTFCSWCHKKTPVLLRNEKDESKFPCYHLCSQPAHAVCLGRYPIDTPTVITSVSPSQPTHRFGVKLGDVFEFSFRVGLSPSGASLYVSSESTCSRHCCFLLSHGISIQKGSADCQGFRENISCYII